MLRSRVLQEALERLELHVAKVTSGVLRGRRVSNGSLLPGEGTWTTLVSALIVYYTGLRTKASDPL
jgi:hypothetical protein